MIPSLPDTNVIAFSSLPSRFRVAKPEEPESVRAPDSLETVDEAPSEETVETAEAVESVKALEAEETVETAGAGETAETDETAEAAGAAETEVTVETAGAAETAETVASPEPAPNLEPQDVTEITSPREAEDASAANGDVDEEGESPEVHPFARLGLEADLVETVASRGYTEPTPIQAEAIPQVLAGRDLLGKAQTGTGKTAAFALPVLQGLATDRRGPQVLVLTPTRELAMQVARSFETYAESRKGFRTACLYGGQPYGIQLRDLRGRVPVVVGTPGRVIDHMKKGTLAADGLTTIILDEADEMLRMGFQEDVEWILGEIPSERQMLLFSATMPREIRRIAREHLRDPVEVSIASKVATGDAIRQRVLVTAPHQKAEVLARILEVEETDGVLVFVNTRGATEPLARSLETAGFTAAALSGEMVQNQREQIVSRLRSGRVDVLVATDVAARGLDVDRISHVVHYDRPQSREIYIHRTGRTGRAGREGDAILFLEPRERGRLARMERALGGRFEMMEPPRTREINKARVTRFHEKITACLGHDEMSTYRSVVEQYLRQHPEVPPEDIAAALVGLAHGDRPLFVREELAPARFRDRPRGKRGDRYGRSDDREDFRDRGGRRDFRDRKGRDDFRDRGGRKDFRDRNGREDFRDRGGRQDFRDRNGREDFRDRGGRQNFRDRDGRSGSNGPSAGMATYRVRIGHKHRLRPGHLVGAFCNEGGLERGAIGRIDIGVHDTHIELDASLRSETLDQLRRVRVGGRTLDLTRV